MRSPRIFSVLLFGVLWTGLTMAPVAAWAQEATPWASFPIPGTPALLAEEAGWPGPVPRVQLARELLRYAYATPAGGPREIGHLRRAMYILLDADAAIRKLQLDQPLVLKADDRARRRNWQSLFGTLGYELAFKPDGPIVKRRRGAAWEEVRRVLTKAGISTDDVTAKLALGESVTLEVPVVQVPLPLGFEAWKRIIHREIAPSQLFAWLLADRTAAMLYVGFTGLDPQTLGLFTADRAVMDAAMDHPLTFAEFSSSLRVNQGRMVSPLGVSGDAAWRDLVGVAPTSPGPFIDRLLSADDGRMAWFYDAVVNYPLATQRYVLAAWLPESRQAKEVRRAYDEFRAYRSDSYFLAYPFLRSTFDPELALRLVRVSGAGAPEPPASPRLLSAIFDDANPSHKLPASATEPDHPEDVLSAGEYLDLVFRDPAADARPRAEAFAFGQRLTSRMSSIPADDLAVLLRGHMRFPALVKTLERLTPARSASLTAPVLRAESFRGMDDRTAAHVGVLQFQAGLALIEAMTRAGGLTPAASEDLVLELSQVLPQGNGYYGARLARWFGDVVIAKLRSDAARADKSSAEDLVRSALTGTLTKSPLTSFEWRGQRYEIDPGADALERLSQSLAVEKAPPLDRLVALVQATDALARATSPDQVHALTVDLEAAGNPLIALVPTDRGRPSDLAKAFQNLIKTLNRINSAGNLSRTKRVVEDLHVVTDWVTGYALLASAYAARMGDPDDMRRLGPGIASLHDLGTTRARDAERAQVPWFLPFQIRAAAGQSWHVEGSVLGLELVLGAGEKIGEGAPTSNAIREDDLIALSQSAAEPALVLASDLAAGLLRISQGLERGRGRLPTALSDLARLPGANYAAIAWALQNEPESVAALVPISQIFALGNDDGDTRGLDAWGVPMARVSGCLCLEFVATGQPDRLSEYADREYLGAFTINLRLKLAELMAQMRVPPELTPALFSLAMRDILASPLTRSAGGWATVIDQFERLTTEQIDGYLTSLTRTRLLRPVSR